MLDVSVRTAVDSVVAGRPLDEALLDNLAHAAVGAGTGALRGDAAAGAVGGAAGTAASLAYEALTEGGMLADLTALGEGAPDGSLSAAQVAMFDRWREAGVTVSALAGVAAAAASGTSVAVAQGAAENAAENNVLPAVVLVVRGAVIAYTMYEVYQGATAALDLVLQARRGVLSDEELEQAAQDLAENTAIDIIEARLRVAKKALDASAELIRKAGLGDRLDDAQETIRRHLGTDRQVADNGSSGGGRSGAANDNDPEISTAVPNVPRKQRQLKDRGWDQASIHNIVNNPTHTSRATNRANGNKATAYFDQTGNYIVRDDVTGELVQMSDRNDPNWIPDPSILDPYTP